MLGQVCDLARRTDALVIRYDDVHRRLYVALSDRRGGKSDCTLSTLEQKGGTMDPPSPTFDAMARLETEPFYGAIRDAREVAYVLDGLAKVTLRPEMVVLNAKGETKSAQHSLRAPVVKRIEAKSEVSATFRISYLERIVGLCRPLSKELEIRMSTYRPVKLSFPVMHGRLEYLVAPHID